MNTDNVDIPKVTITDENLELFGQMAREIMEESDHIHAGMNDNGLVFCYPCGCKQIYLFELGLLTRFVDKRNVALANGSQYDVLYSLIEMIRTAEATKTEPQPEPEVGFHRGSRVENPETYSPPVLANEPSPLVDYLAKKLAQSLANNKPNVWSAIVNYEDQDGTETGRITFEAKDLFEVAERLSMIRFTYGSTLDISLDYIGDDE